MRRRPCRSREALTALEDKTLVDFIKVNGEGERKWRDLPKRDGLKRSGKSCRLRWLNYLNPDINKGTINANEEDLIIRLHKLLGDRWSLIAGRLPGRTDHEIKNYWNTFLSNKVQDTPPSEKQSTEKSYPESSTNSNTMTCASASSTNGTSAKTVLTPQPLSSENHGEEAMGETSDNM